MTTAVYAPLKSPDHPVPSGDRRMARLFLEALERAGAAPQLICRLRTYDRGDPERQRRLDAFAEKAAPLLARRLFLKRPRLWFTYHCHHKAPDGLGPRTTRLLDMPYVIAEASIAPARAQGPWREGYRQAVAAIAAADVVIAMTRKDAAGLEAAVRAPARVVRLQPFTVLPRRPSVAAPNAEPRFVTVAMMRPGAKERSYELLAEALAGLLDRSWRLDVVGDGACRERLETLFANRAPGRVRFHGRIDDADARDALVRGATAMLWPGIDEAYGMALLEAQALGVPVITGNGHGLPDIVDHGRSGLLSPAGDARAFRDAVQALLDEPRLAAALGAAAADHVRRNHSLDAAAKRLGEILALARAVHAARRQ